MSNDQNNRGGIPRLAKLACRIPFFNLLGWPYKGYKNVGTAGVTNDQPVRPSIVDQPNPGDASFFSMGVPGPVGYPFIPAPGISKNSTSAINVSMLKQVGEIADKGNVSYIANIDPQDLGFMFLGIESALLCYNHGVRAFSYHKNFSRQDLYTVSGLYKTMHMDFEDWQSNIPQLLYKLNYFKHALEKLRLPKKYGNASDHFKAVGKIFKDSELEKAMHIIFYAKGYWKYNPTVPCMEWIEVDGRDHDLTFAEWVDIMEDLMSALIGDEDITNLCSYLKKAYTDDECYTVNNMNWDDFAEYEYNPEEVKALHNACFLNYSSVSDMDITQEVTSNVEFRIEWNPKFTVQSLGCNAKRVLDIKSDDPSDEEVYNATKYMFTVNIESVNGYGGVVTLQQCSNMIICNPHVMVFDNNMELRELPLFTEYIPTVLGIGSIMANKVMVGWIVPINSSGFPTEHIAAMNSLVFMSRYHAAPITNLFLAENNAAPTPPETRGKLTVYNAFNIRYNYVYLEDDVLNRILEARIAHAWAFES